jgi:hypothetical protein
MLHHEHSLVIHKFVEDKADSTYKFDVKKFEIIFNKIDSSLNAVYAEGQRALKEGDFKEKDVMKLKHSCDICEKNTKQVRFVCLNCRSLSLCRQCYETQDDNINNLDVDDFSSVKREH